MNGTYQYIFRIGNLKHNKAPAITICYLKDDTTGKIARGISICSPLDPFNYIKGRGKAYGRALRAMKSQADTEPIQGEKGIVACATAGVFTPMIKSISAQRDSIFKSKWDVGITDALNFNDLKILVKLKDMVKDAPVVFTP